MSRLEFFEPIDRETTASMIATRIRRAIMEGMLPPGSQLVEADLASRFSVSRGPVREAIQRLIQEGVLMDERHRGASVPTLDESSVEDIYIARKAIEQTAVALAIDNGDGVLVSRLEDLIDLMWSAVKEGQWEELADLDLRFHETLVAGSGSKRLHRMLSTLLVETKICLMSLEPAYPARQDLVQEHVQLLEAIRRRSKHDALRLVERHLDDAVRDLQQK